MQRICIFDVNETLLDLRALEPYFERLFGCAEARTEWFAQLLHNAFVTIIIGPYQPFGAIGAAALEMLAARHGVALGPDDRTALSNNIQRLPAHGDVHQALSRLRENGFRLAALTNSTGDVAVAQMKNAGLTDYFERILSADAVQRVKPASEPYRYAAAEMGVGIGAIRLIAAHAWDVAGAMDAGCSAAFVARPGKVLDPLFDPPEVMGSGLCDVADQIIAIDRRA